MKTIGEMQGIIKNIYSELDELSASLNEYKKEKSLNIDFEKIEFYGKQNPIIGHPLQNYEEFVADNYLALLLSITSLVQTKQADLYLFVSKIKSLSMSNKSIADLLINARNISTMNLEEMLESIVLNEMEDAFLLDAFIMYLISEDKNDEVSDYLSELVVLLKCDKQNIKFLNSLAKTIVYEDESLLDVEAMNFSCEKFKYYLGFIEKKYKKKLIWNKKDLASIKEDDDFLVFGNLLDEDFFKLPEIISKINFAKTINSVSRIMGSRDYRDPENCMNGHRGNLTFTKSKFNEIDNPSQVHKNFECKDCLFVDCDMYFVNSNLESCTFQGGVCSKKSDCKFTNCKTIGMEIKNV